MLILYILSKCDPKSSTPATSLRSLTNLQFVANRFHYRHTSHDFLCELFQIVRVDGPENCHIAAVKSTASVVQLTAIRFNQSLVNLFDRRVDTFRCGRLRRLLECGVHWIPQDSIQDVEKLSV